MQLRSKRRRARGIKAETFRRRGRLYVTSSDHWTDLSAVTGDWQGLEKMHVMLSTTVW